MKDVDNQSYNRIIKFINSETDISEEDRRYLIFYATQLYKNNVENVVDESMQDIYDSLRELSTMLINCADNSITYRRINDIVDILQKISSPSVESEILREASYKIDKLYCDFDLPVRKNSSLSYNLLQFGKRK